MYRASMGAVGLTAKSSSPGEPRPRTEEQKKKEAKEWEGVSGGTGRATGAWKA